MAHQRWRKSPKNFAIPINVGSNASGRLADVHEGPVYVDRWIWWLEMNKLLASAVFSAFSMIASIAQAESNPEYCGIRAERIAPQSDEVAASWRLVTENAFDADGRAPAQLDVIMLIDVEVGLGGGMVGPPCLAGYLIKDLIQWKDGRITGTIVPTNMDNPAFFHQSVNIDDQMVIDWTYAPEGAPLQDGYPLRYGDYTRRNWDKNASNDTLIMMGMHPAAVPHDWN